MSIGFNRYIVECKYSMSFKETSDWRCFNRYIVECKLWLQEYRSKHRLVLIDTQWNVNEYVKEYINTSSGFNRYIVECKYNYTMLQ